jgi:hypothetical protein
MEQQLPNFVVEYLQLRKRLEDLKTEQKEISKLIQVVVPTVGEWLQQVPKYEVSLQFDDDTEQALGTSGKIRFTMDTRKEYLGKNTLLIYIASFFSTIYPDKEQDQIHDLARATVDHVWLSRKTMKNNPMVTRTFSKKKRKIME